jgi:isoquinoline 1-oxidoreductase subunit beta
MRIGNDHIMLAKGRDNADISPVDAEPGGIGEPGTAVVAPAIVNAIFAATRKRLRRLPIETQQLKAI